jgi:aminoglycoside phosphotransferase (APT) family kinase protein
MEATVHSHTRTTVGELIDEPIRRWLSRHALPGHEIKHARALAGGYSNANILLVADTGEHYVLRRYLHHNTCAVEAALATRLAGIVPVADVIAADAEGTTAGQPVMVSRFMPGDLISTLLPEHDPGEAASLGRSVGAVLAEIGTVTFSRPGLFNSPDLVPGPDGMEPTADLPVFVDRCLRTGNAHHALTLAEQDALRQHAAAAAPALDAIRGAHQLVHSDFNPKNLLATHHNGNWTVTAVLDWEFAFSSSPLFDIGNMMRFRNKRPPAFTEGFIAGYTQTGGHLPENWREISQAADLFALADFLTRPPEHPYFAKAVTLIRERLTNDSQRS